MTEQNHPNYKVGGVLVRYGILEEGRACDICGEGIEGEGYSDGDGYDVCMNCVGSGEESQDTEQLIDFHWLKVKQVQLVLALIRYFNGKGTGNVVFSPHSLFTLLFMLSCGANNCADLRQYCNPPILTGEDPSDEKKNSMVEDIKDLLTDIPKACLSEKIIMCDSLQTVFEENMKKLKANFFSLEDMGVVNEIVQNLTSIPDLIRQRPDATVLIDAIYFKDEWSCKFDGKSTTQDFQNTTTTLKCQMMENRQTGKDFMLYAFTKHYKAVRVEYKTENLGAWFVMGEDAKMANHALTKFLEDFGSGKLHDKAEGVKVNLQVPKFELTSNIDLLKVFKGIDPQITSVFEEGHLLPMTGESNERITNFSQQCFIKVDENGTEAAAATKAETYRSINIPQDIKFDHTFYMVISDSNGRIFFVAKVEDPSPAPAGPPASAGGDKEEKINPFIVNVQGHEYSLKTVAEHPQSAEDAVQHTKVPNSKREHEQSAASIKDGEDIIAERLAMLKRFRHSEYIIAERLAMLKRFRRSDLITEEQYQKRVGEILQDT